MRGAAGGELGAGPPELARTISDLTDGNAVPRLRAVARARRDRRRRGRRRRDAADARRSTELGTPESVREVVSQRLARLAPGTSDLLELAATAGAEFELDLVRRAAGLRRAGAARGPRRGGAQRDDRGGPLARGSPTGSRTSWCAGRSTTASRGIRRAELHLRGRRGARGGPGPVAPDARRPRAPLRRRRPVRRAAARRSTTTSARRGRRPTALAFDEAAARLRTALELGIDDPSSARRYSWSSAPPLHRGGQRARCARGVSLRGRDRARAAATRSCSRGPRSATRRRAGDPGSPTRARWSCSRRRPSRSATSDSALRVGAARRARARARLPGRARARRGGPHAGDRDGAPHRRPHRARHRARCAPTGRAATSSLEESLAMLTEARGPRPRSSATPRSARRRWRGGCRRSWRSATSNRPGGRSRRCSRAPSARRSRSCSTSPSTTARRSRCATAASTRRRRGAALARVEPAAHGARRLRRLRDPDVQHPSRAGAARASSRR